MNRRQIQSQNCEILSDTHTQKGPWKPHEECFREGSFLPGNRHLVYSLQRILSFFGAYIETHFLSFSVSIGWPHLHAHKTRHRSPIDCPHRFYSHSAVRNVLHLPLFIFHSFWVSDRKSERKWVFFFCTCVSLRCRLCKKGEKYLIGGLRLYSEASRMQGVRDRVCLDLETHVVLRRRVPCDLMVPPW